MTRLVRRGFTLVEVVVTVIVVSVIAAVVIPVVIRQITAADPARVQQDLQGIRTGIEVFALNMRPHYPGDVEDLVNTPGDDNDLTGVSYTTADAWRGPYLEKVISSALGGSGTAFQTGFRAGIVNAFKICTPDATLSLIHI